MPPKSNRIKQNHRSGKGGVSGLSVRKWASVFRRFRGPIVLARHLVEEAQDSRWDIVFLFALRTRDLITGLKAARNVLPMDLQIGPAGTRESELHKLIGQFLVTTQLFLSASAFSRQAGLA